MVGPTDEPVSGKKSAVRTPVKDSVEGETNESAGREKRSRVKVEFFKPEYSLGSPVEFTIKEGKGAKLGDIPNVAFHLSKVTGSDDVVSSLHSLLFKRVGKVQQRKRNILAFSGFVYEEDEDKERAKVAEKLHKWTVDLLNRALDAMDMPRGSGEEGTKGKKIERLISFLECPEQLSSKNLAELEAKKKTKRSKAVAKRKRTSGESKDKAKGMAGKRRKSSGDGDTPAKRKGVRTPKKSIDVEEDDDEDEDLEAGVPAEEDSPDKVAKKPAQKRQKPSKRVKEVPVRDDDEDERPLGLAAATQLPSDDEIKKSSLAILSDVNIDKFSFKMLMTKLREKYDGVELDAKRSFIKNIAVEYVRSHSIKHDEEAVTEEQDQTNAADAAKQEAAEDKGETNGVQAEPEGNSQAGA